MNLPSRPAASIPRPNSPRPPRVRATAFTLAGLLSCALPLAAQAPVQLFASQRAPYAYASGLNQQFLLYPGLGPYVTDGTVAGTRQIVPDSVVKVGSSAVVLDGVAYFSGEAPSTRQLELWRTDGTAAGTYLVVDLLPGSSSSAAPKVVLGHRLLFTAYTPTSRSSPVLHVTDGTAAGTTEIGPVVSPPGGGAHMVVHRGFAYFVSADALGRQLWKTDGSASGTAMVHDIFPGGDPGPSYLTVHGDALYFTASDALGSELWTTDGTSAGTRQVVDIRPGVYGSGPRETVSAGGFLFFGANDGVTGTELWRSDGTAAGTIQLTDILPLSIEPRQLTEFEGRCIFSGTTPTSGWELWSSDGSIAGTVMLKDIQPGSGNSMLPQAGAPAHAVIGDRIYFAADDGVQGIQLWVTDGTAVGTTVAFPPLTGMASSGGPVHVVNGKITFTASTLGNFYTALFAWAAPTTSQVVGRGCGPAARTPTIGSTGARVGANWRIRGGDAFPGSIAALVLSTPAAVPIPLPSTACSLFVDPVGSLALPASLVVGGSWFVDIPIPNNPRLNGLLLGWQAIFFGTDNPVGGVDTSPGLSMSIGT